MIFILEALKKMEEKTIINSITCDKGSEFTNYEFKIISFGIKNTSFLKGNVVANL
jgi:IS30 family transposase